MPGTCSPGRRSRGNSSFLGHDLWSCMILGKPRLAPGGGKYSGSFSLLLHRSQKFLTSVRASVCTFQLPSIRQCYVWSITPQTVEVTLNIEELIAYIFLSSPEQCRHSGNNKLQAEAIHWVWGTDLCNKDEGELFGSTSVFLLTAVCNCFAVTCCWQCICKKKPKARKSDV